MSAAYRDYASDKLEDSSHLSHGEITSWFHANIASDNAGLAAGGINGLNSFPGRLYRMLSNPELSDVVRWMDHGRAWKVLQPKVFANEVLPKYNAITKYSNFVRQVNSWGFRRILSGQDKDCYYHELFLRSRPHLVGRMKKPKGKQPAPKKFPNFYDMPWLPKEEGETAVKTPSPLYVGGAVSASFRGGRSASGRSASGGSGTDIGKVSVAPVPEVSAFRVRGLDPASIAQNAAAQQANMQSMLSTATGQQLQQQQLQEKQQLQHQQLLLLQQQQQQQQQQQGPHDQSPLTININTTINMNVTQEQMAKIAGQFGPVSSGGSDGNCSDSGGSSSSSSVVSVIGSGARGRGMQLQVQQQQQLPLHQQAQALGQGSAALSKQPPAPSQERVLNFGEQNSQLMMQQQQPLSKSSVSDFSDGELSFSYSTSSNTAQNVAQQQFIPGQLAPGGMLQTVPEVVGVSGSDGGGRGEKGGEEDSLGDVAAAVVAKEHADDLIINELLQQAEAETLGEGSKSGLLTSSLGASTSDGAGNSEHRRSSSDGSGGSFAEAFGENREVFAALASAAETQQQQAMSPQAGGVSPQVRKQASLTIAQDGQTGVVPEQSSAHMSLLGSMPQQASVSVQMSMPVAVGGVMPQISQVPQASAIVPPTGPADPMAQQLLQQQRQQQQADISRLIPAIGLQQQQRQQQQQQPSMSPTMDREQMQAQLQIMQAQVQQMQQQLGMGGSVAPAFNSPPQQQISAPQQQPPQQMQQQAASPTELDPQMIQRMQQELNDIQQQFQPQQAVAPFVPQQMPAMDPHMAQMQIQQQVQQVPLAVLAPGAPAVQRTGNEWMYEWAPTMSERAQNCMEFGLPITLPCMSWAFGYTWFGVFMCWGIVIVHTIETIVTDFGSETGEFRIKTWIKPHLHHCIDFCLISSLAISMLIWPEEYAAWPYQTSFALFCTLPPYITVSYSTMLHKAEEKVLREQRRREDEMRTVQVDRMQRLLAKIAAIEIQLRRGTLPMQGGKSEGSKTTLRRRHRGAVNSTVKEEKGHEDTKHLQPYENISKPVRGMSIMHGQIKVP